MKQWFADQNRKFSLFTKGRLSRLEFLRNGEIAAIFTLIPSIISFVALAATGNVNNWQYIAGHPVYIVLDIVAWAMYIVGALIGIFATVQRFHDLNDSGWRVLFYLIPIVNIVFACILLFKKGNPTDNKYGTVPAGVKRPWLPIAFAILFIAIEIGFIIFAFATHWPFSILQKQLTEQIMSADASQISQYKAQTGELPASLDALFPTSTMPNGFAMPIDAWGNNFIYTTSSNGTFTLRSLGPDGIMNASDNIVQTYQ
jgi:uncharacterized membrane protein YhaH (DUF805 family)